MAYEQEIITPYNKEETKGKQVEKMFDHIAPTYDRLNHTLSLGIDRLWRRTAIKALGKHLSLPNKGGREALLLDIATGTGDFAILAAKLLKPKKIIGADISKEMMEIAAHKVNQQMLERVISFQKEDCMNLSFPDGMFDAVTSAYGVRNFENLDKGLREIWRVLRPGGYLLIVELTPPPSFPMKQLFWLYARVVMPLIGRLISHDNSAYTYLPASMEAFPQPEKMEGILRKAGFSRIEWKRFTFGISTMYLAEKKA